MDRSLTAWCSTRTQESKYPPCRDIHAYILIPVLISTSINFYFLLQKVGHHGKFSKKIENTNTLPAAKQSLSDGDLARTEPIMVPLILHSSRMLPFGPLGP